MYWDYTVCLYLLNQGMRFPRINSWDKNVEGILNFYFISTEQMDYDKLIELKKLTNGQDCWTKKRWKNISLICMLLT